MVGRGVVFRAGVHVGVHPEHGLPQVGLIEGVFILGHLLGSTPLNDLDPNIVNVCPLDLGYKGACEVGQHGIPLSGALASLRQGMCDTHRILPKTNHVRAALPGAWMSRVHEYPRLTQVSCNRFQHYCQ